jgi:ribose transport system ATP-binding protein
VETIMDPETHNAASGAPTATADGAPPAVRIEQLSKTFPGQRALDDVDIEIRAGEIHALVGQNGSGKSTLIKTLSGFHKPDPGSRAWLGGDEVALGSLTDEQLHSMKFIHQDLALVPTLTVQENLYLESRGRGMLAPVERRRERVAVRELLRTFNLEIDPTAVVGKLTPFEKAAVAIVRALGSVERDAQLLVLDEPTASLGAAEVQQLFATLRHINSTMEVAILYVSHFLTEVLDIADRITVLRDGRRVTTIPVKGTTEEHLIELIVGSGIGDVTPPRAPSDSERTALLAVESLEAAGLHDISFGVRRGEILGLCGLLGSGYEKIAECLAGARPWESGGVVVDAARFARLDPASAAAAGMAAMPADRRGLGLIPTFSIAENVTLPDVARNFRRGRIDRRAEESDVRHWLDMTGVVPPDPRKRVEELSGGNQQKVMLAKALRLNPAVLVLAEPTQAVDVGAAASIRRLITQLAESGHAIVVASSDPEELEEICHRVLVTREGRVACTLVGDEITEDRIVFECQFEGGTR